MKNRPHFRQPEPRGHARTFDNDDNGQRKKNEEINSIFLPDNSHTQIQTQQHIDTYVCMYIFRYTYT